MSKNAVIWFLDSGAEFFLGVSLGSLRLNAPQFWSKYPKIIVDCGLSNTFRNFLRSLEPEGVQFVPAPPMSIEQEAVRGFSVLQQRIHVSRFVNTLKEIESDDFIICCDADTVFLKELDEFPAPEEGNDLVIMPGYSFRDGIEIPTPWIRKSSLMHSDLSDEDFEHIAEQLGLSADELDLIPSYNAGVFGFRAGRVFDTVWREDYDLLRQTEDCKGRAAFAPFLLDQNSLSLSIYRDHIHVTELPRRFNQLPPILEDPPVWPADTVIAHFVFFHRSYHYPAYGLWFDTHKQLHAFGYLPSDISPPPHLGWESDWPR